MVAEATNRPDVPQLLVVVFPAPTLHGPACGVCAGSGLSDEQVLVPVVWDDQERRCALVVDVLCPVCGGCGHAEHELCAPEAHAGEPDKRDQDDFELAACASCGGRGWNPVPTEAGAVLRMPCGCTEDHTHRIDLDMTAAAAPASDG